MAAAAVHFRFVILLLVHWLLLLLLCVGALSFEFFLVLQSSCRGRDSWLLYFNLSYDVASGSEITPCNKICKPLVVYRFSGNVMTSITTLRT